MWKKYAKAGAGSTPALAPVEQDDYMQQAIQKIKDQFEKGEITAEEREMLMAGFVQTPRSIAQDKLVRRILCVYSIQSIPFILLFSPTGSRPDHSGGI